MEFRAGKKAFLLDAITELIHVFPKYSTTTKMLVVHTSTHMTQMIPCQFIDEICAPH